jgi:membrane protein DedA with SNARE-associated domain
MDAFLESVSGFFGNLPQHVQSFADQYGLLALWVGLLLSGLGLPVPEDVYMITGGYLVARQNAVEGGAWFDDAAWAVAVLYSGVMVGDSIVYFLGRRYGDRILTWRWFARFVTPARAEKVRGYYVKYGAATVFIARHTAPVRFVTFLMAGVSRMHFGKFFFWDSLAAILSVPLWFALGFVFGDKVDELRSKIEWVVGVLAVLGLAGLAFYVWRRRAKRPARPTEAS